jgi:type II secretory pathway component GspD/PulD (secretin)
MQLKSDATERRWKNSVRVLIGLTLALTLVARGAGAQTPQAEAKPEDSKPNEVKTTIQGIYQTFYIANVTQQTDLTDISTDLRNMLPKAKLYPMPSQNAISMYGTPDDVQLARKMIAELDRPRKIYRLAYTITETDSGKPAGTQHYALIATSRQKTVLKQGSKVPIITETFDSENSTPKSQVTYTDVGLLIEATVDGNQDGVGLMTEVVQSSLAEEKSGLGAQDPIIRQTSLNAISMLTPGKPHVLGSLDIPGTARKQEIEVVLEVVR